MLKNKSNENSNKIRHRINIFLDILIITVGVISLAVAGVLIYQKSYLTPFWVNGQSMYPTLNKDAMKKNGTLSGETGSSAQAGDYHLDYGVMDCHERAIKKLKRFDIVVLYRDQMKTEKLIKRVIGLPGETIKFTSLESGEDKNGDLYIKDGDSYTYIQQPIDDHFKVNSNRNAYPKEDIVLGSNEYYVLGDNRGHSNDSRTYGKFTFDLIVGKVVAICGYCSIDFNKENSLYPTNITYYKWPRFIK